MSTKKTKTKTKDEHTSGQELPPKKRGRDIVYSGSPVNLRLIKNTPWPGQPFVPSKLNGM